MSTGTIWIDEILPLDRPEYAKQPEVLLTHLIWGSEGSELKDFTPPKTSGLAWLVPDLNRETAKTRRITKTKPIAKKTDTSELIVGKVEGSVLVSAALDSIEAPKSRGITSITYVPIHPSIAAFQTLRGMVNKPQPGNLAKIIENVGWLGGSDGIGHVAQLLLQAMSQSTNTREGFTGLSEELFPRIAEHTWAELMSTFADYPELPASWPRIRPVDGIDKTLGRSNLAAHGYHWTPFYWFWNKWTALCSPGNRWHSILPARRFADWATCLLRTALAFAYLWEAEFFTRLYACLREEAHNREHAGTDNAVAMASLQSMLKHSAILAVIEAPSVPATQKHAGNALFNSLATGDAIRSRLRDHLRDNPFDASTKTKGAETIVQDWIYSLQKHDLRELSRPLEINENAARNRREFVRYLLMPRSSDDDYNDQADFYYLARSNVRHFWFQPGPEWLVVVTGLLGERPGGMCTLGMLLNDLRRLGLQVERQVLVSMLEEAGLTIDSPDADSALVIQSGF